MKRLFYFLFLLLLKSNLYAQSEPLSDFSEKILMTIAKNDSSAFLKYTLNNKEIVNCVISILGDSVVKTRHAYLLDSTAIKKSTKSDWCELVQSVKEFGIVRNNIKYNRLSVYPMTDSRTPTTVKIKRYDLQIEFSDGLSNYTLKIKELMVCDGFYFYADNINIVKRL